MYYRARNAALDLWEFGNADENRELHKCGMGVLDDERRMMDSTALNFFQICYISFLRLYTQVERRVKLDFYTRNIIFFFFVALNNNF